jgi:hypothetical protein
MAEDGADDPTDSFGEDGSNAETSGPERDRDDAPLDDLAREVRARREARDSRASVDEEDDDLFESVEVADVDDEAVWESFVEGEAEPEAEVGLGAEARDAADPDEHVVPKRTFCQRCPHFSAPPETACTHEGTAIVEVVDADHFRVRHCPVVEDEDVASPVD